MSTTDELAAKIERGVTRLEELAGRPGVTEQDMHSIDQVCKTLPPLALSAIALELREIREQGLSPGIPPCGAAREGGGHLWSEPRGDGTQTCDGCNLVWHTHAPDPVPVERFAWAGMETHGKGGVPWMTVSDVMTVDCSLTGDTRWPKGARVEQLRQGIVIGSEKVIDDRGTLAAPFTVKAGDSIRVER